MVKIDTYGGIYISNTLKNYLQAENTSIYQFLYFADFSDISRHIEDKYYSDRTGHLRYPTESLLTALYSQAVSGIILSQDRLILTPKEEAWLPGFERDDRNPEI